MLAEPKTRIPNPKTRAMLLAAIYIAQEQYGWLSPEAVQRVADRLNLTAGQVYSTASFYTMFRLQPRGNTASRYARVFRAIWLGGRTGDRLCERALKDQARRDHAGREIHS